MAVVALVGLALFGLLAFGWRALIQYRRTGDAGFRGFSREPIELVSGLGFVLAMICVVLGPVLDLTKALELIDVLSAPAFQVAGIVVFGVGLALTLLAQLQMGRSWRVGVDPNERTELVTHGVFGYVRNPIFSSMVLAFVGVALMVPNVVAWAAVALLIVGLEVQVRFVEEPYLARVHGDRYETYMRRAGRFLPRI